MPARPEHLQRAILRRTLAHHVGDQGFARHRRTDRLTQLHLHGLVLRIPHSATRSTSHHITGPTAAPKGRRLEVRPARCPSTSDAEPMQGRVRACTIR